jgi:hypothetical protein
MRQIITSEKILRQNSLTKFEKRLESFGPSQYPQLADFNEKHTLLWLLKIQTKKSTNQEE